MSSTAAQMRAWRGPALLSFGFRPFFLGAGVWAAAIMALWIPMLSGMVTLPTAFDPISWHAHEFLFGYLSAVIAGFLLTAVPNWTGRLPILGWPLGGLAALWLIGRVAVMVSFGVPPVAVAFLDLAMPVVLAVVMLREIVAGKNWRNLMVLAMLAVFTLGNAVFHWEAAQGEYAAQGYGLRLGLGAVIMMIALVGGRIVPSFTRNWLARRGAGRLPVPPMQRFDKAALLALLATCLLWVSAPMAQVTGAALIGAGALHVVRLARWAGERTFAEPLVVVLHVAYAFVPIGAICMGLEVLRPGLMGAAAAQHLWMAGATGLMTLAVMTRASLGHSGRTLTAGVGTTLLYLLVLAAVIARLAAGIWPAHADLLHAASGAAWIGGFGGFAVLYGPLLVRQRPAKTIPG
ncbi:NnrS family protein [uncultured Roseovarius sp.]|uniref:NnrS family protein n=1 Tax=uncultured Roseovarius sp. TaxID=293344 RepID=UPI00261C9E65|nr:NnrS family protein [uncultured Roseovarius sp.]